MDAGNMLKPMLARGELRLVGATTLDEYREHIEKDAALERRFQQVFVGEPSVEDTIAILRGLKERYEAHHKVAIADARSGRGGLAVRPLHHRAPAARQGDRPHRRGRLPAADGDRLQPGRDRRAPARGRPAEDGGAAPRQGDRRRLRASGSTGCAPTSPRRPRSSPRSTPAGSRRSPASTGSATSRPSSTTLRTQAERLQREGDYESASRLLYGEIPVSGGRARRGPAGRVGHGIRRPHGQGAGRRRRHRRGHLGVDRHPGRAAAAGRDREAAARWSRSRGAPHRPGRGGARGLRCRAPLARRHRRPRPADRVVPVPRPDRRRQDRARQVARRLPLRRRARHGAHRHVGVLRAARGRAADRRPSRLRRLRGGRPAHRGGAAPALLGGAARRGREGPPRDLRHPAAGARRRPPDRRPGTHGRLPQRHPGDDVEPRLAVPRRPDCSTPERASARR